MRFLSYAFFLAALVLPMWSIAQEEEADLGPVLDAEGPAQLLERVR